MPDHLHNRVVLRSVTSFSIIRSLLKHKVALSKMTTLTIRPGNPHDGESIYQAICLLENIEANDFETFKRCYETNLLDANKIHLVALSTLNNFVGYLSCYGQMLLHHMGMVYEIQEMFVSNDYRRQGVGKKLLAALEEILKTRSCTSFEVTTNKVRTDALRFYQERGFVQTHFKLVKALLN